MAQEYRAFFYSLFNKSEERRRKLLKEWHRLYPVDKKRHTRLADVFREFIADILYEPIVFKMRHDHFCFFGNGTVRLAVRYEWLTPSEREFIVYTAFAQRESVFRARNMYENMHFKFEEFIYNPRSTPLSVLESHTAICSVVWQRELVRDFVWMLVAQKSAYYTRELVTALQHLMLLGDTAINHKSARRDVFLSTLHYALQSTVASVFDVPCWGLSASDIHPEDAYQETIAIRSNLY